MTELRSICVYAGSSNGASPAYTEAAAALGTLLGQRGIRTVYGGGSSGLMGTLADAALAAGGLVTGIIPGFLHDREVAHGGVSDLRVVDSMHTRKQLMADLSDAFIALPGGVGTLEELVECITWAQLGLQAKPICLYDVDAFWAPFTAVLDHMQQAQFMREGVHGLLRSAGSADAVLDALQA